MFVRTKKDSVNEYFYLNAIKSLSPAVRLYFKKSDNVTIVPCVNSDSHKRSFFASAFNTQVCTNLVGGKHLLAP